MPETLPPLSVEDFEDYFTALWSDPVRAQVAPFPWQVELVREVHQERRWPDLIDLPTGAGKTSVLDIAVFLLALDAARPPAERWMPRRVVLVVDRRVVVDQANERGGAIVRALEAAPDGVLRMVAERVRRLWDAPQSDPPLVTTVLRGGIVRDEAWAQRPDVPALISSTVDQVGSRLLFRGYGLSPGMRPIHAGLLANDTLFLLDEVHLARPFAETLRQVARYRADRNATVPDWPDRWRVVQLSATPTDVGGRRFPAEPIEPGSHPVLHRRLTASKPARLEVIKLGKAADKAGEKFATACVRHAGELLRQPPVRTIGVIVNRVDTARRVARLLRDGGTEVCLLTGRMRPMDRDRVLARWAHRLMTGRSRADDEPLVVVATQSIEAGADFDLDGIVTECASLDAIRQRFGRVDRDGALAAAGTPATSVIVVRSTDLTRREPDPVYGHALPETWRWLESQGTLDFGITALDVPADADGLARLLPEPDQAPLLLPSQLDQWVQTTRRSTLAEPDVARWLHGADADAELADVELVWRADLDPSLFEAENLDANAGLERAVVDRVAACPPVSREALAVPIKGFRTWARGDRTDLDTSDAGAARVENEAPGADAGGDDRRWLRWEGAQGAMVRLDEVRPGDTIVVPSRLGGVWLHNWDPSAVEPVDDVATSALAVQRGHAVVRITREAFETWIDADRREDVGDPVDASVGTSDEPQSTGPAFPDPLDLDDVPSAERIDAVREVLAAVVGRGSGDAPVDVVADLIRPSRRLVARSFPERVRNGQVERSYVVWSPRPIGGAATGAVASDDGDDATSFTGAAGVLLHDHLHGVEEWATRLATNLGLPPSLVAELGLAGLLHDVGKVDPRFQLLLHDADEVRHAIAQRQGQYLAKSGTPDTDRASRRRAQAASGYPHRARHELLSLAMILDDGSPPVGAGDPELVRYLVMTHHGFGRYRFEPVAEAAAPDVELPIGKATLRASADYDLARLDRGVPDLFWTMVRRYGWFGLCWLEAILRLADHARSRSREEQELRVEATGDRWGTAT